jgi:uncharacterized membrane protein YczE
MKKRSLFQHDPIDKDGSVRTAPRFAQLLVGLALFGASLGLMVRANLGLGPWDVLHQGVAHRLHLQIGWVVIATSLLVLLGWIPLRQRPGLGTVLNAGLVGLFTNLTLDALPVQHALGTRATLLLTGVVVNALATALYIGAGLGAGPRDGLMLGLAGRSAMSIRRARTLIELAVLVGGWALGGTVGIGTAIYALGIGPLVHAAMSKTWPRPRRRTGCTGVTCRVPS